MRWKGSLAGLTVTFLLAAATASTEEYRSEVTVFAGASFLEASTEKSVFGDEERFEQAFAVGMRYGYVLSPRVTVEASYRYSPNGKSTITFSDPIFFPELSVFSDEPSHAIEGSLVYYISTANRLRPFVVGGLGAEIFLPERGAETSLRAEMGFGLLWRARDGLALRVDAKYVLLSNFYITERNEGAAENQLGLVVGL